MSQYNLDIARGVSLMGAELIDVDHQSFSMRAFGLSVGLTFYANHILLLESQQLVEEKVIDEIEGFRWERGGREKQ